MGESAGSIELEYEIGTPRAVITSNLQVVININSLNPNYKQKIQ